MEGGSGVLVLTPRCRLSGEKHSGLWGTVVPLPTPSLSWVGRGGFDPGAAFPGWGPGATP